MTKNNAKKKSANLTKTKSVKTKKENIKEVDKNQGFFINRKIIIIIKFALFNLLFMYILSTLSIRYTFGNNLLLKIFFCYIILLVVIAVLLLLVIIKRCSIKEKRKEVKKNVKKNK